MILGICFASVDRQRPRPRLRGKRPLTYEITESWKGKRESCSRRSSPGLAISWHLRRADHSASSTRPSASRRRCLRLLHLIRSLHNCFRRRTSPSHFGGRPLDLLSRHFWSMPVEVLRITFMAFSSTTAMSCPILVQRRSRWQKEPQDRFGEVS